MKLSPFNEYLKILNLLCENKESGFTISEIVLLLSDKGIGIDYRRVRQILLTWQGSGNIRSEVFPKGKKNAPTSYYFFVKGQIA